MMSKQCDTKEGGFGKSQTEELFFYRVIKKEDNFDAEMAREDPSSKGVMPA